MAGFHRGWLGRRVSYPMFRRTPTQLGPCARRRLADDPSAEDARMYAQETCLGHAALVSRGCSMVGSARSQRPDGAQLVRLPRHDGVTGGVLTMS